jgi:hypothetical protein
VIGLRLALVLTGVSFWVARFLRCGGRASPVGSEMVTNLQMQH